MAMPSNIRKHYGNAYTHSGEWWQRFKKHSEALILQYIFVATLSSRWCKANVLKENFWKQTAQKMSTGKKNVLFTIAGVCVKVIY